MVGIRRFADWEPACTLIHESFVALKLLTVDCYGAGHDIFEIDILGAIRRQQAELVKDNSHVVGLLDTFALTGPLGSHKCIVMPVLGCSIDLQPSNILFEIGSLETSRLAAGESTDAVTPSITKSCPGHVRIVDFGVGSWVHRHLTDNIQPVHLRAPEVILRAPWGPPVDIWSLGCLVIEFVKGHVAFPGSASETGAWSSQDHHLAIYMDVLGPMPRALLERGARTSEFFDDQGELLRMRDMSHTRLKDFIDGTQWPLTRPDGMDDAEMAVFVDFLQGALTLDPEHRKTAEELLRHEWLQ
ncbi:hypothetical protein LTR56_014299 [Elasticomyces elasticus]|nr:hypothetical protein LTR22_023550 [Elasticomyces elasticus]KAK3636343.1 hypothetical protein LTR56_014299 [Elasticomyces elasticus]KAK4930495.1 hypothetical protein LTR49_002907 [Elasticomyces elasticus]KAK5750468.1 hypothetical protein LTS12_019498 [Elasticomyces elasticus]